MTNLEKKKKEMAKKMVRYQLKDEKEGIKEYKEDIQKSSGKEKKVFKKILPQEENHYRELSNIKIK